MTDALDEKLKEVLWAYTENGRTEEDAIDRIRQAFAAAGYIKMPVLMKDGADGAIGYVINGTYMTSGQEWYDRFVREYHMRADWISSDEEMGDDAERDVLLAAMLASGIE